MPTRIDSVAKPGPASTNVDRVVALVGVALGEAAQRRGEIVLRGLGQASSPSDAHLGRMRGERIGERRDAVAGGSAGAQHAHVPPRAARAQVQHLLEIALGAIGVRLVGLADDQHVGDFEDARLDRLDVVAEAGRTHDDAGVGERRDVDVGLARADRLDDDRRRSPRRRGGRRCAASAARARRGCPRDASERMNTHSAAPASPMRMRSPSTAPPVIGLDGSTATTAIRRPRDACSRTSASISVDLPAPGEPVMPTTCARPAKGASDADSASAPPAGRSRSR